MTNEDAAKNRRKSSRTALILASTMLTGLAGLMPAIARADQAPPATPDTTAPAADASTGGISEIVVTATHKPESLQKVPISIQALDATKLTQNNVSNFADYAQMLPSVSFQSLGPGRSQPFFRGISVTGGRNSTVGTYLDDIPLTSPNANPEIHIYDVERVEALSGPQGTLFGASSLAGTLRIITNKPKFDKWEAGMDVQADKYGDGKAGGMVEGFINIPVAHDVAIRIMAFYEKEGGYINNTHGTVGYQSLPITLDNGPGTSTNNTFYSNLVKNAYNPDIEYGGRAAISWQFAPDWKITPSITYQNINAKGAYNYDPRVGDLAVHDYSPTYLKDHYYQAELAIQGKIGDFDIVSATGYFARTISNANDYTYYSVTYDQNVASGAVGTYYNHFTDKNGNYINPTQQYYNHEHDKTFTQEVRLSTPKSWPVQVTLGGFYQYQRQSVDGSYYIPGLSTSLNPGVPGGNLDGSDAPPFSPAVGGVYNPDGYYLVEDDSHSKDGAAFAEGNYNITSRLKVVAGIRYFIADNGTRGFDGTWRNADRVGCWNEDPAVQFGKFIHPGRLSCLNTNTTYHQTGETHKLGLTWQFQPDKMIYATYSTGFRPGGGNRQAAAPAYKSDTLNNYEVGWKTSFGRNFRWNGALYREDWKGVQYLVVVPNSEGSTATINAGNARVYGIETDLEWRPVAGLSLSASGAYNNAKLSGNFCAPTSPTNLAPDPNCATGEEAPKGTRLPRQPIFKGSSTIRYDFDLMKTKSFVQAQVFHQSGSTSDLSLSNDMKLGDTNGFTTLNFSAGLAVDKYTFELFIENARDDRGILSKNTFCSIQECAGSSRSLPVKPQYFGVKAGFKY
ncbi:TonB-dependent receptor [Novosphingobium sp.]|uniref:TonB-dependent receptor n=1 Tax=Novosphingobium sp. TaxID=1874826 RepID=UPI003B51E028